MYNRALSSQEVKKLYNGYFIRKGLVSYWSFDDGKVKDDYGINNGIIHNVFPVDTPVQTKMKEKLVDIKKKRVLKWSMGTRNYRLEKHFNPSMEKSFQFGVIVHFKTLKETSQEQFKSELNSIKKEGFNMVNFCASVWEVPTKGSELYNKIKAAIDWCEKNKIKVWILYGLQFPKHGEFVLTEKGWCYRPKRTFLRPLYGWIELIKGKKCIQGLILGNEVGLFNKKEDLEKMRKQEKFRLAYQAWLQTYYPSKKNFGDKTLLHNRFMRDLFVNFYGFVIKELSSKLGSIKWELTSKISGYPYLHTYLTNIFTVLGWDHSMAKAPNWIHKLLGDITPYRNRIIFDTELHLYHDKHDYASTEDIIPFVYRFPLLHNQWWTASYNWGDWKKEETQKLHKVALSTIRVLTGKEEIVKKFIVPEADIKIGVVLTEEMTGEAQGWRLEKELVVHPELTPIDDVYAELCNVAQPWKYILDNQISQFKGDILITLSDRISYKGAKALYELITSRSIKLYCVDKVPTEDLFGNQLPELWIREFNSKAQLIKNVENIVKTLNLTLPEPELYRKKIKVSIPWWTAKGREYGLMRVPMLETRKVDNGNIKWVVVVNNTDRSVRSLLPWITQDNKPLRIVKLLEKDQSDCLVEPDVEYLFKPYEVAFFRYEYE